MLVNLQLFFRVDMFHSNDKFFSSSNDIFSSFFLASGENLIIVHQIKNLSLIILSISEEFVFRVFCFISF
jgi:hypothetical protein